MARSELLLSLIKSGLEENREQFGRTVQAVLADARSKKHLVLAERIASILNSAGSHRKVLNPAVDKKLEGAFYELAPSRSIDELVIPDLARQVVSELVEEHHKRVLLKSNNLEPRHRVLLVGPPGNGKTSLAEGLANALTLPFYVVKYEGLITSHLGKTAQQLDRLFAHIQQQPCVLFFDEFDAIGKERGDSQEVGEVKRVVNSLLLQLDQLPSHVVFVAATNHAGMLDRAAWRRFQLQIELPHPTEDLATKLFEKFEQRVDQRLGLTPCALAEKLNGLSFAELEQCAIDIRRRAILTGASSPAELKKVADAQLTRWGSRPV